jgi:pyridoxamine 5'-phosphate oxidase
MKVADLRLDYKLKSLDLEDVKNEPMEQFKHWFEEAVQAELREPNAMVLATSDAAGMPNARVVLLKAFDERGFVFYTNYESVKGKELLQNPNACLVFNWLDLERQVRIRGRVEKTTDEESSIYFKSRPKSSQIGAWASPQSQPIKDRKVIENNETYLSEEYKNTFELPRPEHWGGFRLIAKEIEFWQGRSSRLHDRILYQNVDNQWNKCRLAP